MSSTREMSRLATGRPTRSAVLPGWDALVVEAQHQLALLA
jgi:hypothetical protein